MDVWTKEVEVGGFGNGQFEETTNTSETAFVQDGLLVLKPTVLKLQRNFFTGVEVSTLCKLEHRNDQAQGAIH